MTPTTRHSVLSSKRGRTIGIPLPMIRPLSLFKGMPVTLSSSVTFTPDTILRVLVGKGMLELVETERPDLRYLLKKMAYVGAGDHKASEGLIAYVETVFKDISVFEPGEVRRLMLDTQCISTDKRSFWGAALSGLISSQPFDDRDIAHKICAWMDVCDQHALHWRELAENGSFAEAQYQFLGTVGRVLQQGYLDLELRPLPLTYVVSEVALMALARLEREFQDEAVSLGTRLAPSLLTYLAAGARPIGHWFKEVCALSGGRNLAELSRQLLRNNALYRERAVDHGRIKKWARSKEAIMPFEATAPVLKALKTGVNTEAMRIRFAVARLLTFLCDSTVASTYEAISWEAAQAQLAVRYNAALNRERPVCSASLKN